MSQALQFSELKDEVDKLRIENLRLQAEKTRTVEKIVEVPPSDYQKLQQQCLAVADDLESLKNRCRVLEHILSYSEISPMTQIIKEYKSMSKFYLQQLTKEIEIYRISSEERAAMLDFLSYLRSVTREIEEMMLVED